MIATLDQDRNRAPHQQDRDHDRGDLHDAKGSGTGLVHTLHVLPPEEERYQDADTSGEVIYIKVVFRLKDFIEECAKILAGADNTDRSREDVVEDQRGHGQLRHGRIHAVADDHIHATAHVHAATFEVHATDREAEQHYAQHKPGCRVTNGFFRRAACVERGRG